MRRVGFAALALLAGAIAASQGMAQSAGGGSDSDCILDNCADRRPVPDRPVGRDDPAPFERSRARPRGASRPGDFDFYVLSLSWSPGFCATGGDEKARDQCAAGSRLGFVVHGLWPQYDHGYPSDCRGQTSLSREVLAASDGVYPDERLARYEWRRHGTCSGLRPLDYFSAVRAARDAMAIPPRYTHPPATQSVSPGDVERDFIAANPRLAPNMMGVVCRDNTLEEVRVCFDRSLHQFRACPEVARETCRRSTLDVPGLR